MCEFEQCSECCDPDYVLVLTKARGNAHRHIGIQLHGKQHFSLIDAFYYAQCVPQQSSLLDPDALLNKIVKRYGNECGLRLLCAYLELRKL